jgi:serine/threonine protein kinase
MNQNPRPAWWNSTTITIILVGIVLGMADAHKNKVVHGSLKPNNILLDGEHLVKISDFGALEWQRAGISREVATDALLYIDQSPDDDDDDDLGFERDVYSFGIILYEILMVGKGLHDVIKRIALNKILSGTRPDIPDTFTDWVSNLIDDCWAAHPKQRPTFNRIFTILSERKFQLLKDVKVEEVQNFVTRISRSSELPQKTH